MLGPTSILLHYLPRVNKGNCFYTVLEALYEDKRRLPSLHQRKLKNNGPVLLPKTMLFTALKISLFSVAAHARMEIDWNLKQNGHSIQVLKLPRKKSSKSYKRFAPPTKINLMVSC